MQAAFKRDVSRLTVGRVDKTVDALGLEEVVNPPRECVWAAEMSDLRNNLMRKSTNPWFSNQRHTTSEHKARVDFRLAFLEVYMALRVK